MLTIFRRHLKTCKFAAKGRKHRHCGCPISVEGTLRGEKIRKALDLRSWEAATKLIREWEVDGPTENVSVKDACDRFLADVKSRGIGPAQTSKYNLLTRELTSELGTLAVKSISVDDLRKLREGWKLSAISASKKLERLRSFFSFCEASGWIEKNPAKSLKLPMLKQVPTMPYTTQEWNSILTAAEVFREIHTQVPELIERKLKALILLMRYSGLRISDAVSLKRDRIDSSGRLFLYQAKTGAPVQIPLPSLVINTLAALDDVEPYYFWSGAGKVKSSITQWQERLKNLFVIAGIPTGHGHRLRDTFAVELLQRGVALQTVSILLGHRSISTTERAYNPWVKSRQDALEAAVKLSWSS